MEQIKIFFNSEEEVCVIRSMYENFTIKEINYIGDGGYIIFEPNNNIYLTIEQQGNKISILEEENKNLKSELSVTQDAVNEILFNSMSL